MRIITNIAHEADGDNRFDVTSQHPDIPLHEHQPRDRIGIVDGFRALAILMVIGFHYFSRWTPPHSPENVYPYGDWLAGVALINYGYLGVELFFIVSGFVISLTLFVSRDWADFAWKRFSRLFPTMLLCSVLTYTFLNSVGSPWFNAAYRDFLPSLTFTDPVFWSKALGGSWRSIDGAYWSLQVEVKFYLWACLLFFLFGSQRFLLCFGTFLNVAFAYGAMAKSANLPVASKIFDFVFFPEYLPWFAAGVGFYYLHRKRSERLAFALVVETFVILMGWNLLRGYVLPVESLVDVQPVELLVKASFYWLFGFFVWRPQWLAVFGWKPLATIGAASYSLYLLHQDIGVTAIGLIGQAIGGSIRPATVLIGLAVAGVMILISLAIYRYWEMPAKRFILAWRKRALFRPAA